MRREQILIIFPLKILPMGRLEAKLPSKELVGNERLAFHVNQGIDIALQDIDESFGNPIDRDHRLFYHDRWYTEGVVSRTVRIMESLHAANPTKVTTRDILLAKLAAGFHDVIQVSEPSEKIDDLGKVAKVRKRATGDNEKDSAASAVKFMTDVNALYNGSDAVFTPKDIADLTEAIMLTTPTGWDGNTVFAPEFSNASLITKAVQLADLGGSGMDGAEVAIYEALSLFAEEQMDFRADSDRLLVGSRRDGVALEDLDSYKARLLGWLERQENFVNGRKMRVRGEIASFSDQVMRDSVNDLFKDSLFDDSVAALKKLHEDYAQTPSGDVPGKLFSALSVPPHFV